MKTRQHLLSLLVLTLAVPTVALAAEADKKAKPYPLDKCIVSDEKLGADPSMKPYVFVEAGQEVKLCCKSCLKDFNKDKASYMKKIAEAEKKPK
jgi:hypothetical protein